MNKRELYNLSKIVNKLLRSHQSKEEGIVFINEQQIKVSYTPFSLLIESGNEIVKFDYDNELCYLSLDIELSRVEDWLYSLEERHCKLIQGYIYKITNKNTGKIYVGQTKRLFYKRWYEHINQQGSNKLYQEIQTGSVTDFIFEVIEVVKCKEYEIKDLLNNKERYWIDALNIKENGYNVKI